MTPEQQTNNMNNPINNGGPAFPHRSQPLDGQGNPMCGEHSEWDMTLRDYFAGQAMAGLCANSELFKSFASLRPELLKHMSADECDKFEHKSISMSAKSIADAMIAAREVLP